MDFEPSRKVDSHWKRSSQMGMVAQRRGALTNSSWKALSAFSVSLSLFLFLSLPDIALRKNAIAPNLASASSRLGSDLKYFFDYWRCVRDSIPSFSSLPVALRSSN